MSTSPKSHVPHGEGPGRHEGTEQHGWSPDVDATHTQDNPSARRSFDTPPEKARGQTGKAAPSDGADEVVPVESTSRSGEDLAKGSRNKGHHDLGPRGRSQRPSGGKDDDAYTGVDAQEGPRKLRKG
ncbi:hypothetical protein BX286_0288 [Streptomyces sp. 3211.6]|uniref:hypothetical protein n=1 Tax=Streptomyces TaxID=1883 RepID=UPI0009A4A18B|nr:MULTISPECIES: hypothetical protein [Streptomyces]RKT02387.1 hypothetical protein BX286_0288 [Streptomyces sp. 3211.6]RPF43703.1 hypothetical protein EDD96_0212 [Streptomyces sp. Ag109_G2-6]